MDDDFEQKRPRKQGGGVPGFSRPTPMPADADRGPRRRVGNCL
jgi:hypothetical protein